MRSTGLTTPDPVTLQNALADFVERGFAACAIEASSIGIAEHRLAGTQVEVAVFTNFTQDHLDYHGDMRAYWQAKAQLFAWPGLRSAVVNLDDAQGLELADSLAGSAVDCWTVSMRGESARLRAEALRHDRDGLAFDVVEGDKRVAIATPLIGDYNAANLLCVIGVLRALGVPLADAATACAALTPVPGRMQRIGATARCERRGRRVQRRLARTSAPCPRSWSTTPTRPMRSRRRSPRWRRSPRRAAAGSGACSAAAATATPPSGR